MSRLFRLVIKGIHYGLYWVQDYWYALKRQLEVFRKHDAAIYTHTSLGKNPIIVLPGIYERWYFMRPLIERLHQAGYPVYVVEQLGRNTGEIADAAEQVERMIQQHALRNSIVVAHSKGGLIGKYLLIHSGVKNEIQGIVCVNTPFTGSLYAQHIPSKRISLFSPSSKVIQELNKNTSVNNKIISIYGEFDPHIPGGSHLSGAKNIKLHVFGHFKVLEDEPVLQAVLQGVTYFSH